MRQRGLEMHQCGKRSAGSDRGRAVGSHVICRWQLHFLVLTACAARVHVKVDAVRVALPAIVYWCHLCTGSGAALNGVHAYGAEAEVALMAFRHAEEHLRARLRGTVLRFVRCVCAPVCHCSSSSFPLDISCQCAVVRCFPPACGGWRASFTHDYAATMHRGMLLWPNCKAPYAQSTHGAHTVDTTHLARST